MVLPDELPVPDFFDPQMVGKIWRVPYAERAGQARIWAADYQLQPSERDKFKLALVLIDVQNTFCIPDFELYVGGRSGSGAVDDNARLVEFIYRNLALISHVYLTLDTHQVAQIFHPIFLVNEHGENPQPYTLITAEDIREGRWKFNHQLAGEMKISPEEGQSLLEHYTNQLAEKEKFDLTVWPYHAMLGGIGHALVPAVEEAVFFHALTRYAQPEIEIKGTNPFLEHYSAIGPEVLTGPQGKQLADKSEKILRMVEQYEAVVIAGQAKSHCVAWTISDLLAQIQASDPNLAGKVYLLEDCTSPVVVPGAIDYTEQAEVDFSRFAAAGMHLVHTSQPIPSWPGIDSRD